MHPSEILFTESGPVCVILAPPMAAAEGHNAVEHSLHRGRAGGYAEAMIEDPQVLVLCRAQLHCQFCRTAWRDGTCE